jgi:hypothetical protein
MLSVELEGIIKSSCALNGEIETKNDFKSDSKASEK